MHHRLILVGNLGRDPESKYMPDGRMVTEFSVATSKGSGDKRETIWWRVTTFGKTAETCAQFLAKGRKVYVEGSLRPDANGNPRIWKGQDGASHSRYEVYADIVRFLDRGETGEKQELDSNEVPF